MTEAFATVQMPAKIGPNKQATLRCKVNTGTGGNVMPLHAFSKLFQRCVTTDGTPTGLRPTRTCLTAYNGSTIKQYGTLDTAIDWKPEGKNVINRLHTQWYIADTPGPTILGLPSCSKLRIVELNCAVSLCWRSQPNRNPQQHANKYKRTSPTYNLLTPKKISSRHTQTDSKELDISQAHTTSLSRMMPDLLSMHHEVPDCYAAPGA